MTPKFTTSCFIRKNTPELRKKLEELGYTILFSARNGLGKYLVTTECGFVHTMHTDIDRFVDCGTNEQLFLALAALREDSDKFQYFVYDEDVLLIPRLGQYIPKGGFSFCMENKFEPILPNAPYHKVTSEELIEYFKEK